MIHLGVLQARDNLWSERDRGDLSPMPVKATRPLCDCAVLLVSSFPALQSLLWRFLQNVVPLIPGCCGHWLADNDAETTRGREVNGPD